MMSTVTVSQRTTLKIKFPSQPPDLTSEERPCSQQSVDRSWSSCCSLGDNSHSFSSVRKRARPNPEPCLTEMKIKMDRSMSQQCSAIVKSLIREPEGWIFKEPVDPIKLGIPDYSSIIKKPMDLGTIKSKLDKNLYITAEEFVADVHLTFSNATLYNPPTNSVHQMAKRLLVVFDSRWASLTGICQISQFKNSRSKLHTVVSKQVNAQEPNGSKALVHHSLSSKKLLKSSKPKGVQRLKASQTKVLGQSFKKKNPVEDINCDRKTKCDVNLKGSRSDQESDVSALSEEIGISNAACNVTPEASSPKDWNSTSCEAQLSPAKALRAAMVKERFAATILKARQKTLQVHPDASDSATVRLSKERLEKEQREERARIEAQIKAAEAASRKKDEVEMKLKREREREAARVALQKIEKTAGIEMNVEIMMELERLTGGYSPCGTRRGDLDSPLQRLGLFIKDDTFDETEEADMDGGEEGEILL